MEMYDLERFLMRNQLCDITKDLLMKAGIGSNRPPHPECMIKRGWKRDGWIYFWKTWPFKH